MSEYMSPIIHDSLKMRMEMNFEEWLQRINGINGDIIRERVMTEPEIYQLIMTAPGSRGAHQAFEGGYHEHMRQTMMIASHLYELAVATSMFEQLPPEEHFTESDALLVLFLHDIEKPFLFTVNDDGAVNNRCEMTKPERTQFRTDFIESYDFKLNDQHWNALDFVEGVRDHLYIPGNRADKPLAALCHAADNMSARAYYNYKQA